MSKFLSVMLFCIAAAAFAQQEQTAMMQIQPQRLAAHVSYLASDLLEGRGTATRGYDLAALYVATQFQSLGLKPAGDQNTFYQQVPFRKSTIVPDKSVFTIQSKSGEQSLEYDDDFLTSADYIRADTEANASVVFAGYGVTAPDLKYDDYAGLDVHGKIVLLLSNGPPSFPASQRAHFSNSLVKDQNARAHGAIGIVSVRTPDDEKRGPWERNVRQNRLSAYRWKEPDGKPHNVFPEIQASAYLSLSGAKKLFEACSGDVNTVYHMIDAKSVHGFSLDCTATIKKSSTLEDAQSPNVIGMLEGSDSSLKNQYVVFTAHLDHLGISDPVNGDRINNGAYDNGTGIASLLEIARAFTTMKVHPKRSVLFVAVTGEEKGLQGSDFFANHPTVPIESLVADINMDMLMMLYPFSNIVIIGAEHSSLGQVATKAAESVGLKVSPDPAPEEVRFVRSDQYSFIKQGIPAIFMITGFDSTDPSIKGEDTTRKWLRTIYHSPQDDDTQVMHWESGVNVIRASFLTGYSVANAAQKPQWNANDFFGITFGRKK